MWWEGHSKVAPGSMVTKADVHLSFQVKGLDVGMLSLVVALIAL